MFRLTSHARERMKKYSITEEMVSDCIKSPDNVISTYNNRKIYQKALNGYVLRLIVKEKNINIVITCYKARRKRYEIQI